MGSAPRNSPGGRLGHRNATCCCGRSTREQHPINRPVGVGERSSRDCLDGRRSVRPAASGGAAAEKFFLACPGKHRRQTDEHVAVVDPRIVAVTLAGGQQAEVDRRRTAAAVAAAEKPVPAAQTEAPQRVLAFVVVDVQPAIFR